MTSAPGIPATPSCPPGSTDPQAHQPSAAVPSVRTRRFDDAVGAVGGSVTDAMAGQAAVGGTGAADRIAPAPAPHAPLAANRRYLAALLVIGGSVVGLGALCGGLLLAGVEIPSWLVLAGRWIPALVSLVVIMGLPAVHRRIREAESASQDGAPRSSGSPQPEGTGSLPGAIVHWWGLRPDGSRPVRRVIGTSALAVVMLLSVYLLATALAHTLGAIEAQPVTTLGPALLATLPIVLVMAISTMGEEVVWRSHLPALLAPLGFWGSAVVIALAWTVFHLPLHAAYVLEGSITLDTAATLTVGLIPLSLFLSTVAVRWGSVWPAVFAHALPFTTINLAANSAQLEAESLWAVTGITTVLLVSAALAIAPVHGRAVAPAHRSAAASASEG